MKKGIVWFVSRHPGARDYARHIGLPIDRWTNHLNTHDVMEGDIIYGTLPLMDIFALNQRDIAYFHLVIQLDEKQRGVEISLSEMLAMHIQFRQIFITTGA